MSIKKFYAFSAAEVLVALALVGVLCVTMLSLNNMTDRNYQIATTKLSQVDSAIKSWGKAISKSNETGLGAAAVITNQDTLDDSLSNYLNNQGKNVGVRIETTNNDLAVFENGSAIELDNGVTLNVKYLNESTGNIANNQTFNDLSTPLAIVTANIKVTSGGNEKFISEEYVLKSNGVQSLAEVFEGWAKYEIVEITGDDGNKLTGYCPNTEGCNPNNPEEYIITKNTPVGSHVYIKEESVVACAGAGFNGSITTQTIGKSDLTTYTQVTNTCCPSPKVANGWNSNGEPKCECVRGKVALDAGYEFSATSSTCQVPCEKGKYEFNHVCTLCTENMYCPTPAMSEATACPKGYYCPNDTNKNADETTKKQYHKDKYANNDVADGGLIDKVICSKGSYCPKDGAGSPTICPAGYYCPDDGMTTPKPCPAGMKGKDNPTNGLRISLSDSCEPCAANTYSKEGATQCTACPDGQWSNSGSAICSSCPVGTEYKNGTCTKCPAGTYNDKSGEGCKPCEKGTYQKLEGQMSCNACPSNSNTETAGATSINECKCEAGYAVQAATMTDTKHSVGTCPASAVVKDNNSCKPVPKDSYSPDADNCSYTCPSNSSTKSDKATGISECKCNGGWAIGSGDLDNCPLGLNGKNSCEVVAKGAYSWDYNNCSTSCPANSTTKTNKSETIEQCLCVAGWGTDVNGSPLDGTNSCNETNPGYYSPDLDNKISACECGTYQDEKGQASCKNVAAGNYPTQSGQFAEAAANMATTCPEGYACAGLCNAPSVCPTGTYAAGGNITCTNCPAGTYGDKEGMAECSKCPKNTYTDEVGQDKCIECPYYKHTTSVGSTSEKSCICNKEKPDDFVLEDGKIWNPDTYTCVSNNKVYIVATYNNSIWYAYYRYDYLTVGENIKDFAGVNNYSWARHSIFSGAGSHNWNTSNDKDWVALYNRMPDEVKNLPLKYGEAYIILADGSLLATVAADQIGTAYYARAAYHSDSSLYNPDFEVVSSLNVDGGWGSSEEGTGGQISYKGITYDVVYTIFRKETPLVLDLKGDGLKFTNVQDGVDFDLNADGNKERTAWTSKQNEFDDAFIVYDKNNNGIVDNGSELFGTQNGAENGFAELAKYDENGDGVVDKNDSEYNNLKLWCDMNKNGITDDGELKTLEEANITELSTSVTAKYDENGNLLEDEHGNTIGLMGHFKMLVQEIVNGVVTMVEKIRDMIDVLFQTT